MKRRARIERTFHRTGSKCSYTRSTVGPCSAAMDARRYSGTTAMSHTSFATSNGGSGPSRSQCATPSPQLGGFRQYPPGLVNGGGTNNMCPISEREDDGIIDGSGMMKTYSTNSDRAMTSASYSALNVIGRGETGDGLEDSNATSYGMYSAGDGGRLSRRPASTIFTRSASYHHSNRHPTTASGRVLRTGSAAAIGRLRCSDIPGTPNSSAGGSVRHVSGNGNSNGFRPNGDGGVNVNGFRERVGRNGTINSGGPMAPHQYGNSQQPLRHNSGYVTGTGNPQQQQSMLHPGQIGVGVKKGGSSTGIHYHNGETTFGAPVTNSVTVTSKMLNGVVDDEMATERTYEIPHTHVGVNGSSNQFHSQKHSFSPSSSAVGGRSHAVPNYQNVAGFPILESGGSNGGGCIVNGGYRQSPTPSGASAGSSGVMNGSVGGSRHGTSSPHHYRDVTGSGGVAYNRAPFGRAGSVTSVSPRKTPSANGALNNGGSSDFPHAINGVHQPPVPLSVVNSNHSSRSSAAAHHLGAGEGVRGSSGSLRGVGSPDSGGHGHSNVATANGIAPPAGSAVGGGYGHPYSQHAKHQNGGGQSIPSFEPISSNPSCSFDASHAVTVPPPPPGSQVPMRGSGGRVSGGGLPPNYLSNHHNHPPQNLNPTMSGNGPAPPHTPPSTSTSAQHSPSANGGNFNYNPPGGRRSFGPGGPNHYQPAQSTGSPQHRQSPHLQNGDSQISNFNNHHRLEGASSQNAAGSPVSSAGSNNDSSSRSHAPYQNRLSGPPQSSSSNRVHPPSLDPSTRLGSQVPGVTMKNGHSANNVGVKNGIGGSGLNVKNGTNSSSSVNSSLTNSPHNNGGNAGGAGNGEALMLIKMNPDSGGRFGFNVKGGADQNHPIIVSRVAPGSPADQCFPRLNEGDQVLLINGRDVSQHTHDQVVRFIRSARESHSGELILTVRPNVYVGEDEPEFQYVPETPHLAESVPRSDLLAQSLLLLRDSLASGAALAQFEQLYRKKPGMTMNACRLPENIHKNRYRDICPYDSTRVVLAHSPGGGDYINANFVNMEIPASGIVNRYIAVQGPLPHTTADFWQAIWEQQCHTIIMLTATVERGRVKCHQYWPNAGESVEYNGLAIRCTRDAEEGSCTVREFLVVHKGTKEERQVSQLMYVAWPDHGVPDDPKQFVEFVNQVRTGHRAGRVEPIVVHCSAGIGRTGVLILMESAMCLIEANEPIYTLDLVRTMRDQRAMLIQTSGQYKFVCEAILKVYNENIVKPLSEYQVNR